MAANQTSYEHEIGNIFARTVMEAIDEEAKKQGIYIAIPLKWEVSPRLSLKDYILTVRAGEHLVVSYPLEPDILHRLTNRGEEPSWNTYARVVAKQALTQMMLQAEKWSTRKYRLETGGWKV